MAAADDDRTLDPGPADGAVTPEAGREQQGDQIGPFKLLQVVGEGGFGTVWMAEQREPVRRRVALKIIKLGMDTRQVIARFEAERQALAMMDHPNIAKVLDAGATATGRPYFAMELVKGVTLLEYCDQHKLPVRERLQLFVEICHAIQHAHQKGIIHRDIKPSNVLVTLHDGVPVPKVIDFGIAKATNQELTEKTLFTEFRQMIGTPAYMSPEQAEMSGLDIDTRSDIYSMGVLLYELLTGTTPFDIKALLESGYNEMMRAIREVEPRKPSTRISELGDTAVRTADCRRTDVRRLNSSLRGDLDWIALKCLEKDRTRRYETASALAEDIRRHLAHEPVLAGAPSLAYRLSKLCRRNRGQVITAALVLLALLLGVVGTTLGMLEAEGQRAVVRAQAERASAALREVTEAYAGLQAAAPADGGARSEVEELAQTAIGLVRNLDAARLDNEAYARRMEAMAYAGSLARAVDAAGDGNGMLSIPDLRRCPERLRGWEWELARAGLGVPSAAVEFDMAKTSAGALWHAAMSLHPSGKAVMGYGHDRGAWSLWDVEGAQLLAQGAADDDLLQRVALSPAGDRLATTGRSGEWVAIWDAASGQLLGRYGDGVDDGTGQGVAFNADGGLLAFGSSGGVRVLRTDTFEEVARNDEVEGLAVAWSPDGRRLFAVGREPGRPEVARLVKFDVETGEVLARGRAASPPRADELGNFAAVSPDGSRLLLPVMSGNVRRGTGVGVFDGETLAWQAEAPVWSGAGSGWAAAAAWNATGELVAVQVASDLASNLVVLETTNWTMVGRSIVTANGTCVAFSRDGQRVLCGGNDGAVQAFELGRLATRIEVAPERLGRQEETVVEFVAGGKAVVLGGNGGELVVLELDGARVETIASELGVVHHVATDAAGSAVVAATDTGVWRRELRPGASATRLVDGSKAFVAVACSRDGRWIAASSSPTDGAAAELWLWDRQSGAVSHQPAPLGDIVALDFADDGRVAAVATAATGGHQVGVFDCVGNRWAWRQAGGEPAAPGTCVAFAADGRFVYSGDAAGFVTRWRAADGERLARQQSSITAVRELRELAGAGRLFVQTGIHLLHVLECESLETLATLDVRGRGTDRDSAGWSLAVYATGGGRVAVTRGHGNLLLVAPQWPDATVAAFAAAAAATAAEDPSAPLVMPAPADAEVLEATQLNAAAWEIVRLPGRAPADVEAAVEQSKRSVALQPDATVFLNTLGVACYRAGRRTEAIEVLEQSLQGNLVDGAANPQDALFLAMAYHGEGRVEDAARMLDVARVQLREHRGRWVVGPMAKVVLDELMRQWAEAEQLLHGALPPDFDYDLSKPPLSWR